MLDLMAHQMQYETNKLSFTQSELIGYNVENIIVQLFKLSGSIDCDTVRVGLERVVNRFDILAAAFGGINEFVSNAPVELIDIDEIDEVDLTGMSEEDQWSEINWLMHEATGVLDLESGPMIHFELYRLDDTTSILLLATYGVVLDDSSAQSFMLEFSQCCFSAEGELDEPYVQYSDYVTGELSAINTSNWKDSVSYWEGLLLPQAERLNLNTDGLHNNKNEHHSSKVKIEVPVDLQNKIGLCATDIGVDVPNFYFVALRILLHLYTGGKDFNMGFSDLTYEQNQFSPLIGSVNKTLVIRRAVNFEDTIRGMLDDAQVDLGEAKENSAVTFPEITRLLMDSIGEPINLDVNFRYFSQKTIENSANDFSIEALTHDMPNSIYEWEVMFSELNGTTNFDFIYNTDLFSSDTIKQAIFYYIEILKNMEAHLDADVNVLFDRIGSQNTQLKSHDISDVNVEKKDESIIGRFDEIVSQHGDLNALKFNDEVLTYYQLADRVSQMTNLINANLNGDAGCIGLLFEQSIDAIVAMLAVLSAGRMYVLLDSNAPVHRLQAIIEDCNVKALATHHQVLPKALKIKTPDVQLLTTNEAEKMQVTVTTSGAEVDAGNVAYIIYTSGSTGAPKGVVQTHENILHFIDAYTEELSITEKDSLTLFSFYCFDAAVIDIYSALLNGAMLCIFDLKSESLGDVVNKLNVERISIYHSTPTVYRYFIEELGASKGKANIKRVVLGGEPVYFNDIEMYKKYFSEDCKFFNLFGSTESSFSAVKCIDKDSNLIRGSVPIGEAVRDTEIFLQNPEGKKMPIYGEICVQSRYITPGYWGGETLNDKVFKLATEVNEKVYLTGDMGRILANGDIQYCGRKDFQVKIRGYRVELGEVEAVLVRHKLVGSCVTIVSKNPLGEAVLIAFYLGANKITAPEAIENELSIYLEAELPNYMMPTRIIKMDSFPLTVTRKIDKIKLSEQYEALSIKH